MFRKVSFKCQGWGGVEGWGWVLGLCAGYSVVEQMGGQLLCPLVFAL